MPKYLVKVNNHYITTTDLTNINMNIDKKLAAHFIDEYEAHRHAEKLLQAFGATHPYNVAIEELVSTTPITWNNILSSKNIQLFEWDLYRFADEAKKLGYNYVDWSGAIYDVVLDCQTGVLTEDVPICHLVDMESMQERLDKLSRLEAAGVDNWDGYGYAMGND